MKKISRRLQAVASLVSQSSIVADIGTDHALLLLYLTENQTIIKGYGVENKLGPFKKAMSAIKDIPNLTVYLADGLSNLPEDVNTVILSGLGGEAIVSILNKHLFKLNQLDFLIISPHSEEYAVRKFLYQKKWSIDKELIILERKKFYQIMRFVPKEKPFLEDDLFFGQENLKEKSPTFYKMLNHQKEQILKIIDHKDLPMEKKASLLWALERIEKYAGN